MAILFMSGHFWRSSAEQELQDFVTCYNQYVSQHLVATNDIDLDPSSEQHIELGDVCMIPQQQITSEFPAIFYVAIAEWVEADRKFAKIGKIDQIWNNFNEIFSEQNQNRDIQLTSSIFDKFGLKFRNSPKYQQYLIYQQSFDKHVQRIKHKNDKNIEIYEQMIT